MEIKYFYKYLVQTHSILDFSVYSLQEVKLELVRLVVLACDDGPDLFLPTKDQLNLTRNKNPHYHPNIPYIVLEFGLRRREQLTLTVLSKILIHRCWFYLVQTLWVRRSLSGEVEQGQPRFY